eukprot:1428217-Rhodomonas_salina.1
MGRLLGAAGTLSVCWPAHRRQVWRPVGEMRPLLQPSQLSCFRFSERRCWGAASAQQKRVQSEEGQGSLKGGGGGGGQRRLREPPPPPAGLLAPRACPAAPLTMRLHLCLRPQSAGRALAI